jgi:hypothetical protein
MLVALCSSIAARARSAAPEDGFTIIELMFALVVLIIGILGMFMGFVSAQKLSLVSERETSMAQIAQREIERVEGISYSQIAMSAAPGTSTDPANPDYYVTAGSAPSFKWDRTGGSSETLVVDATNGTVTPVQSWTEGRLSGQMYDFVTWTTDPKCSPGCNASQNYKRVTVAVTANSGPQPNPVYTSSVVADPAAKSVQGTNNGTIGNPLTNPNTTCTNAQGQTVSCTSPINSGNPNTYYLHDWAATNNGTVPEPSSDNSTHPTVGTVSGQTCTTSQSQAGTPANVAGCPAPDLMDANSPVGLSGDPLYHYSTDQASDAAYPGGRLLQPTCSSGLCTGSSGGGTGSTSDCNGGAWANNLLNVQSALFVTAPVSAKLTLTGDGGISIYTQTLGGTSAVVSFCAEIYDVPPSGSAGSLADLLAYPPTALGGAAYVPVTDPATGGNWPTSTSQVSYIFNFRGSLGAVSIPAGDRVGVRLWAMANSNTAVDLVYDNPSYPSEIQLNSQ